GESLFEPERPTAGPARWTERSTGRAERSTARRPTRRAAGAERFASERISSKRNLERLRRWRHVYRPAGHSRCDEPALRTARPNRSARPFAAYIYRWHAGLFA